MKYNNLAQKKAQLIRRLSTIASVVGDKGNIPIRLTDVNSRNVGSTNGREIKIISGDFNDQRYVDFALGLAWHEAGHVAESCFEIVRRSPNQLFGSVLNIIEDCRQERIIKMRFPGAAKPLEQLNVLLLEDGKLGCPDDVSTSPDVDLLYGWLLHYVLSEFNNDHVLERFAVIFDNELVSRVGAELVNTAKQLLAKIETNLSPEQAFKLTEELIELFSSDEPNSDDSDDDDSTEEDNLTRDDDSTDGSSSDEDSTKDDDSTNGSSSGGDSTKDDDSTDGGSSDEGSTKEDDSTDGSSSGGDSTKNDDSTDGNSSGGDSGKQAACSLELDPDQVFDDRHEQIKQLIETLVQESSQPFDSLLTGFCHELKNQSEISVGSLNESLARNLANKVKLPLRRALIDQAKTKRSYVRDGLVLAQNRLVDLQISPTKVKPFSHVVRGRSTSAAVSLIIDQSGSMSGIASEIANTAAYATSIALSQLPNVKHQVLYMARSSIFVAKKLSDSKPLVSKFRVDADGGTPTDVLVARAMMDLALVKKDKKVIIVVTDGTPNDTKALLSAVEDCELLGIKVVGIGIQVSRLSGLSGELIQDVTELPNALKSAIDSVLL